VAAAEANQVDLILMGEYSHAVILEWLVGSKLDFVLHNTEIPVLVD
jgi:nucleotide-binding universal stress UspA family protein